MLDVTEKFKTNEYVLTIDNRKTFDSLGHRFLLTTLEKLGFVTNFIDWIKIFLNAQESCVINGGVIIQYFKLQKGAQQCDLVPAYLFVLCLKIFFKIVKNNKDLDKDLTV